jgi:Holliday junction resolvase RusA-like endonuclease
VSREYSAAKKAEMAVKGVQSMIKLIIPGRPVPCVRMTQRSKFTNPQAQRYLEYKQTVGWIGKSKINQPLPKEHFVCINMQFWLYGGQVIDLDNLIKSICDSLNGIAWVDDKQVTEIMAKRYKAADKLSQRAEIEIGTVI